MWLMCVFCLIVSSRLPRRKTMGFCCIRMITTHWPWNYTRGTYGLSMTSPTTHQLQCIGRDASSHAQPGQIYKCNPCSMQAAYFFMLNYIFNIFFLVYLFKAINSDIQYMHLIIAMLCNKTLPLQRTRGHKINSVWVGIAVIIVIEGRFCLRLCGSRSEILQECG